MSWVDWKQTLLNCFMPEYQELHDGMDLVRFRQTGSLVAYVREFTSILEGLPKMDEYAKRVIFLSGLKPDAEWELFKQPTLPDTCGLLKKVDRLGMGEKEVPSARTSEISHMGNFSKKKGGFKRPWDGNKARGESSMPPAKRQHQNPRPAVAGFPLKASVARGAYFTCGETGHILKMCPKAKVNGKVSVVGRRLLEGNLEVTMRVSKQSEGLMFLKGEVANIEVSFLVDTRATHSFMSLELVGRLGLQIGMASKPIKVRFGQGKAHLTSEIATRMKVECGEGLVFEEDFIVCCLDGMEAVLGNTLFDRLKMELMQKPLRLSFKMRGKRR
ncbi:hypothetical protein R1flu_015243 [Riccia fluitans]|uniref:Retrotransposon gag domain-containing protein n=1 Tax=Riccia fluitans TaxID=41844 RepID=A0ABD1YII7_9MARC